MSQRGRGCCPGCKAEYLNRTKPPNCTMCGFALGGTYEPSKKKLKYSPRAVEVSESIYSVRTSTKDDRCFVTTDGTLWFCTVEGCKTTRSVKHNSSQLADFTCPHIWVRGWSLSFTFPGTANGSSNFLGKIFVERLVSYFLS
jgi:hypothetical protein